MKRALTLFVLVGLIFLHSPAYAAGFIVVTNGAEPVMAPEPPGRFPPPPRPPII
ncbi:MAG: hypothetical protein RLZZ265_2357, partial [Verrucomicrobiota bacterium]